LLVLSALLVSRGLAASAPTRGDILVNAVKAEAPTPVAAPPTDATPMTAPPVPATANDPIVATRSLDDTHFQRSGAFPASVCGVVGQPGQFSQGPVGLSATLGRPWGAAVAIATIAQAGEFRQIAPGALFFHAASMRPSWSGAHERIAQIGDHIFYR